MNILATTPAAPGTPPSPRPVSISQVCHDVFERASQLPAQHPGEFAAIKGATFGAGATAAGAMLGVQGPAGLILAGAIGMALGSSVEIDRQGWDYACNNNNCPLNAAGAKIALSLMGAAGGVGLAFLGGTFPGSATLLAATIGGAAMGYAYRQIGG